MDWSDYIDSLKDSTGVLAKDQLKSLINDSLSETDEFVKHQAQQLAKYIQQLANAQISKDDFNECVQDLHDLLKEELLKDAIAAKAAAQRLVQGIQDLVLNGLSKLL